MLLQKIQPALTDFFGHLWSAELAVNTTSDMWSSANESQLYSWWLNPWTYLSVARSRAWLMSRHMTEDCVSPVFSWYGFKWLSQSRQISGNTGNYPTASEEAQRCVHCVIQDSSVCVCVCVCCIHTVWIWTDNPFYVRCVTTQNSLTSLIMLNYFSMRIKHQTPDQTSRASTGKRSKVMDQVQGDSHSSSQQLTS